MKKLVFGFLLIFLIPTFSLARDDKQFYTGVTGGLVKPVVLHEIWNNIKNTQTATGSHSHYDPASNNFFLDIKFHF